MGLPRIDISFDEIVNSVLKRSRNGSMALLLKVASGSGVSVFTKSSAISGFSDTNAEFIKLAFKAGVTKLIVAKQSGDIEEALEAIDGMEWSWLAVPQADDTEKETAAEYVKQARSNGKTYKIVLGDYENGDSEGIVNLANSFITSDIMDVEREFTPEEYSVYIAGLLTGTALDESLTGYELGDVTNAEKRIDADADVDEGRLILIRGGDRYEIARAVTSLVLTNDTPAAFKKIKNVEGADLIKQDIARIFMSLCVRTEAAKYWMMAEECRLTSIRRSINPLWKLL